MATWNDEAPDPDFEELAKVDPDRAKEEQKQEAHGDPLKEPAEAEDYNFDNLDMGDLLDNVTGSFDDDIGLPRT